MDNQFASPYMPFGQAQTSQTAALPAYGSQAQQAHHSPAQQHTPHEPNHTTLPPLQGQNGYAHYNGISFGHPASASHTPTAPATPVTQATNGYAHLSPANAVANSHNGFAASYPLSSQSMAFSSAVAPALASPANAGLPTIRPMPPSSSSNPMASLPSIATGHLGQQTSFMHNEEAPTHVVGSQGRRGILPSAPGRPNAATATASGSTTKGMALQKDADGKYPCPHCNKTYLHAKHLKRHMLRHTGDRPYSCHLCKDTFSRSDILKRHFQKCSIRRGNPSGLSHLAHQRRNGSSNDRLSISQQDGPIGLAGLSEVASNGPYSAGGMVEHGTPVNGSMSTRTSRANSLITPGNMSHRNSVAGLGILSPNGHGADMSHTQSPYGPPMHGYALSNGGAISSAYAFAQPGINSQFYQSMQPQQPLPFMGHSSSRYDHSHSNSPHQQSPTVGNPSQQELDSLRLLAHSTQDGFVNGAVNMSADGSKVEHDKHLSGEYAHDQQPLAQAWP